jgi:hypothetical protein
LYVTGDVACDVALMFADIRFAMRAEVQHREPFVPLMNFVSAHFERFTATKSSTLFALFTVILSLSLMRVMLTPPPPAPVPDLVRLSSLAKSLEPLIFYSENGHTQITSLQETSVAVWDLGESVRQSNMTSSDQIVSSLDNLSDSLKTLSLELTRFFASVDADVDGILIVMDWAKREVSALAHTNAHPGISSRAFDRVHALLSRVPHLLESPTTSQPTPLATFLVSAFGAATPQRTRSTLTRTFHELLGVLEEAINSELTHSAALFALFEAIDRQFLNLQRTVVRETDTQERLENDLLSSLWTRLVGGHAGAMRKFEKNKALLATVRARTVSNKHLLLEHHGRLQTLKVNLEALRRKLVSPLISRNDSLSLWDGSGNGSQGGGGGVLEGQIRGLEGTYEYLRAVREKQKGKLMELVYGARGGGAGRLVTKDDEAGIGIDAR